MDWNYLIILLINAIVVPVAMGCFKLYEKRKTKQDELKHQIDKAKADDASKNDSLKRNNDMTKIYRALHSLLVTLNCDRVYIIQPHPLGKNQYITITYEITASSGIAYMGDLLGKEMPTNPIGSFMAQLGSSEVLFLDTIDQIEGDRARAYFSTGGGEKFIIQPLKDDEYDWIGSIFIEYLDEDTSVNVTEATKALRKASVDIQYNLPAIV